MATSDVTSLLARTELFAEVPLTSLETIAARLKPRRFGKGEAVFHQGDEANGLHVIVAGTAKAIVISEEGEEMVLAVMRSPDVFGELAVLDGGRRSAGVEALEPLETVVLTRATFLDLIVDDGLVLGAVMRHLGELLRRLTERNADFVFLDLHGRVAKLLVTQIEDAPGRVLDLGLTQAELASIVGGTRQSVNQILRDFDRRGYIEMAGKTITILDPDALQRRAGG